MSRKDTKKESDEMKFRIRTIYSVLRVNFTAWFVSVVCSSCFCLLSVFNYTDMNLQSLSVTQTRLTQHLKDHTAGFACWPQITHRFPSRYCFPKHSVGFKAEFIFFFGFSWFLYRMKINMQSLPVHHNERSVSFCCGSYRCVVAQLCAENILKKLVVCSRKIL